MRPFPLIPAADRPGRVRRRLGGILPSEMRVFRPVGEYAVPCRRFAGETPPGGPVEPQRGSAAGPDRGDDVSPGTSCEVPGLFGVNGSADTADTQENWAPR